MQTKGFILLFTLFISSFSQAAEKLTYVDLLNRLTDLEQLAVLPEISE